MWKYCRPSIGDARITACCESMRLLVSSENANKQMMVRFFFSFLSQWRWQRQLLRTNFVFFHFAPWLLCGWHILHMYAFEVRPQPYGEHLGPFHSQCGSHIFCFVPFLSMSFAFFSIVRWIRFTCEFMAFQRRSFRVTKCVDSIGIRSRMWGACCLPIICNLSTTNSTTKRISKNNGNCCVTTKLTRTTNFECKLKCCCCRPKTLDKLNFVCGLRIPERIGWIWSKLQLIAMADSFFVFTSKRKKKKRMKKMQFQHRKQRSEQKWSEHKKKKMKRKKENDSWDSCSDSAAAQDVKRKPKNAWNRFLHGICAQCAMLPWRERHVCAWNEKSLTMSMQHARSQRPTSVFVSIALHVRCTQAVQADGGHQRSEDPAEKKTKKKNCIFSE